MNSNFIANFIIFHPMITNIAIIIITHKGKLK